MSDEAVAAQNPQLLRTETRETLQNLGVAETPPPLDYNYPDVGHITDPVFPEEYTIETATGLVPEKTLEQVRSRTRTSVANEAHAPHLEALSEDLEKAPEPT